MSCFDEAELEFDASTFSGTARLFPLPNLVLYPHVMQPLHIFEDRYREMLEDALATDGLIAMAVLEPGWEPDYDSRPPVQPWACLGKVVAHNRLPDGRYNLLLLGVGRVRIVEELPALRSFRQAKVELVEDCCEFPSACAQQKMQDNLLTAFRDQLPCACQMPEQLEEILTQQMPLGLLTDLAAYALPLEAPVKQQLLAEPRVAARAETLLAELQKQRAGEEVAISTPVFPPRFSEN